MIINIKHKGNSVPLDVDIKETIDGDKGADYITFTMSAYDEHYRSIDCEDSVLCNGKRYIIKLMDCTDPEHVDVTAYIDRYDLMSKIFINDSNLVFTSMTISEMMSKLYGLVSTYDLLTQWSYTVTVSDPTVKMTLDESTSEVTFCEVIEAIAEQFGCHIRYDSINKKISIIDISTVKAKGLYIIDQLNLKKLEYTRGTDKIYTRLYIFGAAKASAAAGAYPYVNISEINNGKAYVEDFSYTDRVIEHVEHYEDITDATELLNKANMLIKENSAPTESFTATIADVASLDPKTYNLFNLAIYDRVKIIDRLRGKVVEEQIMKIERDLDSPENTTIEMAEKPVSIIDMYS